METRPRRKASAATAAPAAVAAATTAAPAIGGTDCPSSAPEPVRAEDSQPSHECGLCDRDVIHKMAHVLLLGLATACIDSTTGDIFHGPAHVAVDVRRDLVDYLKQRSETYVAEFLLPQAADASGAPGGPQQPAEEVPEHPTEILSDLSDDFAATRRNILGRVSGWLLSEAREEKIDDFAQELDSNGFWLPDRREAVAESLLKNLDYKKEYHCPMRFESDEQLEDHRTRCAFRLVRCSNEGCKSLFCASHAEKHDAACPCKVIQCEQKCPEMIVRREMDRHCITVCPMKLVNCPFYQVGCQSAIPTCAIPQHCEEFLHNHLIHVLQALHKKEGFTDDKIKDRALLLEKSQTQNELSKALDVRSLTQAVKKREDAIKKQEEDYSVKSTPSSGN